jgi:hypothetical protein
VDALITRFNLLLEWIDLKDHFYYEYKIDVGESFNTNLGYKMIVKNNIKYIGLRLIDNKEWSRILSQIFNTKIKMIRDGDREGKKLKLYNEFKRAYKISDEDLKRELNVDVVKYYLENHERERYENIWKDRKITRTEGRWSKKDYELYNYICMTNRTRKIERSHYMDEGCICKECQQERERSRVEVLKGLEYKEWKHEELIRRRSIVIHKTKQRGMNGVSNILIRWPR